MNSKQLVWLNAALEEALPVDVADQFVPFTFDDLRVEEDLLVQIGREQWEELQDWLESHRGDPVWQS